MIGETLGHYRIEAQLGAGGMGVVYRAHDTQLERTVAVKVIGESLEADATARARLIQEARAASALNHPNICTIHEAGEAGGRAFIVMEYVEGRPLSALTTGDGLPVETVIRYGSQIADALSHAHERGVVHRDLKSSNVIVTPEGRPKVLDFGLAKRLRGADLADATRTQGLTAAGVIAGTLSYMAPEVLRGQPADQRSDIWALGVVLYEIAAGKQPFQGQTGFELTAAILREPPAPLAPQAPAGLRAIIQRCLAKEPGERYQHAGEVRAALETLQSAVMVPPAAGAPGVSRRRWVWALVPIAVLAAGLGWHQLGRRSAPSAGPRLSTRDPASANQEANEYFEKANVFILLRGDLPRGREMLEKALALDPHFAAGRAFYGFTHWLMIDMGYSSDTNWYYRAEEDLRRALQDDPNSAPAHSGLAAVYVVQGRKDLVPAEVQKALAVKPDDRDALHWLAHYHRLNGDSGAALALWKQIKERDPLFWPARMNYGDMLRQQGDTAGAIRELEKILEQDPQHLYATQILSRVYMDLGDLSKARQSLERGRSEDRETYHVRTVRALLLALEGKGAEALQQMDQDVLKIAAAFALATSDVADVYAVLGDTPKALEWLDRAVRNGDERVEWFRRDPLLANIREHPRFQQILDTVAARRLKQ